MSGEVKLWNSDFGIPIFDQGVRQKKQSKLQIFNLSLNSCAFFLLDARTFFWHFSARTLVTEISVTTDLQQHAIWVKFGLKTRLE